jgi:hypothetical protein
MLREMDSTATRSIPTFLTWHDQYDDDFDNHEPWKYSNQYGSWARFPILRLADDAAGLVLTIFEERMGNSMPTFLPSERKARITNRDNREETIWDC